MKLVIAGAGSIGCYCGALLADAGHNVTLLGRAHVLDSIRQHRLTVTDFAGLKRSVPAAELTLSEDPTSLRNAELIIVTVKSGATPEMSALIAEHAPDATPVVSWQNGLKSARALSDALPGRDVRAGMVPFNVVPTDPGSYHRATSGEIIIQEGPGELDRKLTSQNLPVIASDRIEAVQWGKLVLNLNNALNALSGLTLIDQLTDPNWRRLMADQMSEALKVLGAAGRPVTSTISLPAWVVPHVLRLPTPLFTRIAARMLTIDPNARTSMAYDLRAGRQTEIDDLQGEIIRLGAETGVQTPICTRVSDLIRHAPENALFPDQIRP